MLDTLKANIRHEAEQTARKAAFGFAGGLLLAAGIAFWTAAAWMFLLTLTTSLNTALIIGSVYAGGGLICLALAARRPVKPSKPAPAPKPASMDSLVAAFMTGLNAGARTRS